MTQKLGLNILPQTWPLLSHQQSPCLVLISMKILQSHIYFHAISMEEEVGGAEPQYYGRYEKIERGQREQKKLEDIKNKITQFTGQLVQTLRISKFRNSRVVLFNDSTSDGFLCSEYFNSLSRMFNNAIPNSTLAFFHLTDEQEQLFEYNLNEDQFKRPPQGFFAEEMSLEASQLRFTKFTVTTKTSNLAGVCLTNDKKMETRSLLETVLKDGKVIPIEIV